MYDAFLALQNHWQILTDKVKSRLEPFPKGFWNALGDISPDEVYVVASKVKEAYPMKGGVMVSPLQEVITKLQRE